MCLTGINRETIYSRTGVDVVFCSQDGQINNVKSTIIDHYTDQIELDEELKETGLKMLEDYRIWVVLGKEFWKASIQFEAQNTMFTGFFGLMNCGSIWKISTNFHSGNKTFCAREKIKACQK